MKIGLVSDVHAEPDALQQALDIFTAQRVDKILCAGDIAGYHDELDATVQLLIDHHCECVVGNHDQSWLQQHLQHEGSTRFDFLASLPLYRRYTFDGKKLYLVHAEPPDRQHGGIKLLDENGKLIDEQVTHWQQRLATLDADILVVGHTHQVYAETLGHVLTINPGSVPFNHSCAVLHLPAMRVEPLALPGRQLLASWHWSGPLWRKTPR